MKFNRIALIAMTVLAAACNKNQDGMTEGSISFTVASCEDVIEVTKSNVSDYTSLPAASAFTLNIVDKDGAQVWKGLLSEWDSASQPLSVGNYSVSASYSEEGVEGFDKPYFTGNANFGIVGGQTTNVSIPVALANSLVKVDCTDAFKNYFPEYSFTVVTGTGTSISFPMDETRAAFVDAFKFTISGTVKNQAGKSVNFSKEYTNLEAATCYTVLFDADNTAGLKITITFNDTVETVSVGDVELND